jgi:hypothetical protein
MGHTEIELMFRWLWTLGALVLGVLPIVAVLIDGSGHTHCVRTRLRCEDAGTTGGWSAPVLAIVILAIVAITGLVVRRIHRPQWIA